VSTTIIHKTAPINKLNQTNLTTALFDFASMGTLRDRVGSIQCYLSYLIRLITSHTPLPPSHVIPIQS